jgi:signal transduction histidine kinase
VPPSEVSSASRAVEAGSDRSSRAPAWLRLPGPAYVLLALAGAVFGLVLADTLAPPTTYIGVMNLFVGWSFIGVGIYAWWRRPSNWIGPLMTATGFLWFVSDLTHSSNATVFTFAGVFGVLYHATSIHLLLAFPTGRVRTRASRFAVTAGYVLFFFGNLLVYLVADLRLDFDCASCAENLIQITDDRTLADVVIKGVNVLGAALLAFVLVRLVATWRRSEGWRRRAFAPLVIAALATTFLLSLTILAQAFDVQVVDEAFNAIVTAYATVPYAFLLGLLRSRMLGGGAVGHLATRIGESRDWSEVEDAVREAVGDPSLELGCRQSANEIYRTAEGKPLEVVPGSSRALEPIEISDSKGAAFLYDAELVDDPGLVRAAATAAGIAMHKHELEVELRTRLEELRSSRERIVEASYEERRRLERNLHDGAQQRLVSLALELRLARAKLESDPVQARDLLDSLGGELELALGELRELARGIHPPILSDRGLDAAIGSLAAHTPFEVEVETPPDGRLPENVESAAYFVVSEALANATKHAQASNARVRVTRENGEVKIEVSDDGVGGADPSSGSGLRGLVDRVAALNGGFAVESEPGHGTTIRASIPCG